ncbi:MAG TPA: SusC/RagA family TonB-linked outer membrane protein [Chitinophagaceae bacterium]|nr:SusC/RagA family TonB-linked outer membrane protein [Chitinophagaceae bacterium]
MHFTKFQQLTMTPTAFSKFIYKANYLKRSLPIFLFILGCFLTGQQAYGNGHMNTSNESNRFDTTIRGRIVDSTGTPISGVTVVVKGTSNGTVTNMSGDFTLSRVPEGATLSISTVGYVTREIRLTPGQTNVALNLVADAGTLGDVVVTGFQRIEKTRFTGAAVKLNADQIRTDGMIDVSRMLEGRAAGVSVQNVSGTFGAAPKVRIRGATSITGENKPLWVIDGVVLEDIVNISNDQLSSGDPNTLLGSAVAGLNTNDIESFDILKDASATALYGARAMNGVIVITTKRGRTGAPTVAYTGNFGVQLKPNYSNFDIMNSADQMSVYAELERKGFLDFSSIANRSDAGVYGKMADLIRTVDPATGQFALSNTPEARTAFLMNYAGRNTDWFDILFRNSLTQEHSLSLSHGTEKAQSFFSTSYYNDQGWTIADRVKRYTANIRNTYNFSDRFTVGFKVTGSVRQQESPGTVSRRSNPVQGAYDRDFDINPFSYALNTSRVLTAFDDNGDREYFRRNFAPFNIINEVENNFIKLGVMDVNLTGDAQYKFTPWLTYNFIGAIRYVKSTKEHQITEFSNQANAFRAAPNATIAAANRFLYRDPDDPEAPPQVVLPYGGFYNRQEDELKNYTVRNSLTFNKTYADVHQVQVLAGQEIKYTDRQNSFNTGFGYQYENGGVPFVDYRIMKQFIENSLQYYGLGNEFERFVGFFGNLRYTYNKKYTLEGTVRRDGSNRLGRSEKARWLNSWTVGGRWNVDQEAFMDNIPAVSYLTFRASYGLNANYGNATNSLAVLRTKLTNRPYLIDRQLAIDIENLENADLTWEKKYEANVGADLGLFQNRVNVSVDAYKRRSLDLINLIRTSGIGGELTKAANYADLDSKGIEFSIGGRPVAGRNFSWQTNLTFGYNTNKITNAENFPLVFDLVIPEGGAKQGYPVRGLFSIPFAGLDALGIPQFGNEKGDTGTAVYLQSDETQFLKYEGPVDPTLVGGFTNTFTYKGISLGFHISYQAGNKIRLNPAFRASYTDLDALPNAFKNRWSLPGDENVTNVPSIADSYTLLRINQENAYPYNNYNYSTARVVDGSFVRLKSVTAQYSLPARVLTGTPIKTASLSIVGTNLWLIYSDADLHGQDPEFFNAGGVALPINKQFTASLKLGF